MVVQNRAPSRTTSIPVSVDARRDPRRASHRSRRSACARLNWWGSPDHHPSRPCLPASPTLKSPMLEHRTIENSIIENSMIVSSASCARARPHSDLYCRRMRCSKPDSWAARSVVAPARSRLEMADRPHCREIDSVRPLQNCRTRRPRLPNLESRIPRSTRHSRRHPACSSPTFRRADRLHRSARRWRP